MKKEPSLADYPYVVVRFRCRRCTRAGQSRLARLAEKYGADLELEELLDIIAATCELPRRPPFGRRPRKVGTYCGIYLPDFEDRSRPPDKPAEPVPLRAIDGSGKVA